MKILIDHNSPFLLAHGGFQTQIEQTKRSLEQIDLQVEWLRWWDSSQTGDLIHYFGRPPASYIRFAQQKGMRVVIAELLTGPGSRPAHLRKLQKLVMLLSKRLLPRDFTAKLAWESYQLADAIIALTAWEKQLMIEMFDAYAAKVHVVPNGVEAIFFPSEPRPPRDKWLICTATITERKRVNELAESAHLAGVPLWIIGKPYAESDPYYTRFLKIARNSEGSVRYEGGISDRTRMASIYQSARGFVLLSAMESLSLSALEAAASGCPLLLSDLPWARCTFGEQASYCSVTSRAATSAAAIRTFYDQAPTLPVPSSPLTWLQVADQLRTIYRETLMP